MYKYALIYVCILQFVNEVRVLYTPLGHIPHAPNILAYIFICININLCILHFVGEVRVLYTPKTHPPRAERTRLYIYIYIRYIYIDLCMFRSSWAKIPSSALPKNPFSTRQIYSLICMYMYIYIHVYVLKCVFSAACGRDHVLWQSCKKAMYIPRKRAMSILAKSPATLISAKQPYTFPQKSNINSRKRAIYITQAVHFRSPQTRFGFLSSCRKLQKVLIYFHKKTLEGAFANKYVRLFCGNTYCSL